MRWGTTKLVAMFACVGWTLLAMGANARDNSHPRLSLKDLSGGQHSIADYRGKILVLNFWATWCGPCREELPMLNAVDKKYAGRGVVFVEASLDDKKDSPTIPSFLAKEGVDFPVWVGANTDTLKRLGLGRIIPATMILDREGEAVGRLLGEARPEELTARLDWILGGESGPPPAAVVTHY